MNDWLILVYKIPREPTASRVYVWRKLKQIGALLLHDSAWILPANDRTREQLQWPAAEIVELKGEATLAHAEMLTAGKQRELRKQFCDNADVLFKSVLKGLKKRQPDLPALSRLFRQGQQWDFFQSDLAARAREALLAAQGKHEA